MSTQNPVRPGPHRPVAPAIADADASGELEIAELEPKPSMIVRGDMEAVRVEGEWIELGRRHVSRRLLRTLADAYPAPLEAWDLFELTWPDVTVYDVDALNRLYTAIHRLRALGLDQVLACDQEGYRITNLEYTEDE